MVSLAMSLITLDRLDDHALTVELARLAGCEREATAGLVAHLAEFDARRLYEGEGFPSVFKYCTVILRLSEDSAYNRIQAARAARRFPAILEQLAAGGLSVTTVRLLAPHLTAENHERLLTAADGKGKREVEHLLATWFPQPDVAPSVRRLPVSMARLGLESDTTPLASAASAVPVAVSPTTPEPVPAAPQTMTPAARRPIVRPLAAERFEIRFTATIETLEKLRAAQDLLGHAVPTGDLAQVFDRALTLLVADLERKKFATTSRPRMSAAASTDDFHIPAAVRRGVVARDRACCAFVSRNGRRCEERRFLEFHHIVPRAAGGRATIENIELRCRTHNGYAIDQYFGPGKRRTRQGCGRVDPNATQGTRSGTSSNGAPGSRAVPARRLSGSIGKDEGAAGQAPSNRQREGDRRDAIDGYVARRCAIAAPTSRVPRAPPMSDVVRSFSTAQRTAASMRCASAVQPRCSSIRPAVRIAPIGFATFLPANFGAEPCTGSNRLRRPGWMLPEAAMPSPPCSAAAEVGDDVAEHVAGHDDLELRRVAHHLQGQRCPT